MRAIEAVCSRTLARVAVLAAIAAGTAGCSAEFTRFNENLFGTGNPASGNSVAAAQPAPVGRVESTPLHPAPQASGGQPTQLGPRNLASQHDPSGRQKLATKINPKKSDSVHVVASGENLIAISKRYNVPVKEIASINRMGSDARLKSGDRIIIPGAVASTPAAAPKPLAPPAAGSKPMLAEKQAPQKVALAEPPATARLATPAPEAGKNDNSSPRTTGATPAFRWPVRGRIISAFGPSPNGQANDGINLAVPEGTAVRASEDGVVAYAGSELKGYGNLVLVRHSNGYVTAYAHASELMVKRGDNVRRGQVIAKSGQTGTVNAPQLHFEIRKGSTPVDPSQYLPNA